MKVEAQIFKSYDYSQFKSLKGNRDINYLHIKRLKESFKKEYLLSPININEKFEIIDGQHRFEAAKELGLPIYYYITNNYGLKEVQILNTNMKNWKKEDYLNAYCDLKYPEYIKFKEFMDKYPDFSISSCEAIVRNTTNTHSKISNGNKSFQDGGLKFNDYNKANDIANKIMMVKPYYEGYNKTVFIKAMIDIMKVEGYNHKTFIKKLSRLNGHMKNCSTTTQYKEIIEKIYNHKSRNPLSLRYIQ
ncbi:MAG: ParB N-terminal domain-containing protein [bacterium]